MADGQAAEAAAWSIASGFAARNGSVSSDNFYAVYEGGSFNASARGTIGVMACAHTPQGAPNAISRPGTAAQLAVHEFAEGYFGAQRTISAGKAAASSLQAVNRWLAGQAQRGMAPVSLSALLFHHRRIFVVQVGACLIYRLRGGALTPLMRRHVRADGTPSRALGLDEELAVDLAEELVEEGDSYLLLAGVENADAAYAALLSLTATDPERLAAKALEALPGTDISAMALRVDSAPPAHHSVTETLAHLPLRPAPREGDVWDEFEIGKSLYRGRYTLLVAAQDRLEKREVALKIPLPSMLQDEIFTAGFMREAWIGSSVRGQNVVRYLDLPPERRSSLYLVMPLYKGETLERRLHRPPLMSLPESMGIALKLCEAVQDLAAIQIIHRDLKPENVMLLGRDGIRLLDLGLAYLPGIDTEDATKPGGTIRYMAPELLKGAPASARTEVYALAVTIYRMFASGAFPFGQRETVPLERMRPDLPRWLGLALQKAMAPKPEERFADAAAFAEALQIGLVEGGEAQPRKRLRLPFTTLQIWRALTLLFALGFFFLLARDFG